MLGAIPAPKFAQGSVGHDPTMQLGPRFLPERRGVTSGDGSARTTEYVTEVSVLAGSPLAGKSIQQAFRDPHPELAVIEVVRGQEILWPGTPGLALAEGDIVVVRGRAHAVAKISDRAASHVLPELGGMGVRSRDVTLAELASHFGEELGRDCMVEIMPKLLNETQADELNTKLERIWPSLTGDLRKMIRPASEIADALRRCGAPTDYHQIGLSRAFFSDAVLHAREIRNRYTFLDLAADSRRLLPERLIDR